MWRETNVLKRQPVLYLTVLTASSEHLFPATFKKKGYVMGSTPKQKREETSLSLVTVQLPHIRKLNLFVYVDAHVPKSKIEQMLDKNPRGYLRAQKR